MPSVDEIARRRASQRRYDVSDKGRERSRRYEQSDYGCETRREWARIKRATDPEWVQRKREADRRSGNTPGTAHHARRHLPDSLPAMRQRLIYQPRYRFNKSIGLS